ncbi:13478_t:CDS:2, partial [Racocetra persica]
CKIDDNCKTTLICAKGQCAESDKRSFNASCLIDKAYAGEFCRIFTDSRQGCTCTTGEQSRASGRCGFTSRKRICAQNSGGQCNNDTDYLCETNSACGPNSCNHYSVKCTLDNGKKYEDDNDCESSVCDQKIHVCQDKDD